MNETIFYFFYNLTHQSKFLDNLVVFFAVYFPYVMIILVGVFLLMHHEVLRAQDLFKVFLQKKKEILLVFIPGVSAWILAQTLKFLIQAPRPFDLLPQVRSLISETGYSFPSGHATFYSALAFSIFFLHKKTGYVFILFAFLIGIARIAVGVHFPVDILGGFLLGFLISYIFNFFTKK